MDLNDPFADGTATPPAWCLHGRPDSEGGAWRSADPFAAADAADAAAATAVAATVAFVDALDDARGSSTATAAAPQPVADAPRPCLPTVFGMETPAPREEEDEEERWRAAKERLLDWAAHKAQAYETDDHRSPSCDTYEASVPLSGGGGAACDGYASRPSAYHPKYTEARLATAEFQAAPHARQQQALSAALHARASSMASSAARSTSSGNGNGGHPSAQTTRSAAPRPTTSPRTTDAPMRKLQLDTQDSTLTAWRSHWP